MRVRYMTQPELTGKTWDNHTFAITNCDKGDCHTDIMNKVVEGDRYINGVGQEFICVYATQMDKTLFASNYATFDGCKIGQNWLVTMQPVKKDGTIHRGQASSEFQYRFYGWDIKH